MASHAVSSVFVSTGQQSNVLYVLEAVSRTDPCTINRGRDLLCLCLDCVFYNIITEHKLIKLRVMYIGLICASR